MLQVYILEDDQQQRQVYQQLIDSYLFIEGLDMKVMLATADPQVLLQQLTDQPALFFLDIELTNATLDGLQVAEQIRARLNFAEIVFVTTHSEMAFLTFERKVEPLDYILKDRGAATVAEKMRGDIKVAYQRYQKQLVTSTQYFSYQIGSRLRTLPLADVLYIVTVAGHPGKIEVHYINGMVEYAGNLNQLATKYPQLFRCHKSWLINPAQVAAYDIKQRLVTMQDGSQCEVSFRKEGQLRRRLLHNDNRPFSDVNK
ncbi:LytR/AlgR family response regulator transcription factor [Loigolactobacillus binensis]|uniref:LytR/AlgR family response regulator transcription factor n=1 Tax=Loigolactobacillus binensis TaxID=2559922 RepID=A0ABW3EEI8_9LACO|nr:response regulator transcription factor [Loigolactobacillus binensis]